MHSGSLEKVGTPRKRTLSRGMSEDESLRHLIKEAEGSAKRLTRTDSKVASLKKPPRGENQAEEDLITNFPEMLEPQEGYEEVVQELRELEVQRVALLFQVDCLQDALEGAEEMLAEARREADSANEELERERQAKRRLEESADSLKEMVAALTEEIHRLKEERVAIPTVPVYTLVTDSWPEGEGHAAAEEEQKREGAGEEGDERDGRGEEEPEVATDALEEASEWVDAPDAPLTLVRLDSTPSPTAREGEAETTAGGILAAFFKKGRESQAAEAGHSPLRNANLGSSVDSEDGQATEDGDSPLTRFQRMFNKTFGATPGVPPVEGLQGPSNGLGAESTTATPEQHPPTPPGTPEAGRTPPTPQQDGEDQRVPESRGGDAGPRDGPTLHLPGEPLGQGDGLEPRSPKSPDSCVVS